MHPRQRHGAAGHNDLAGLFSPTVTDRAALLVSVAGCVLSGAEQLLSSGAVDHVVVGTLAPGDLMPDPRNQTLVEGNLPGRELIRQCIEAVNALLAQGVRDMQGELDSARTNQTVLLWDIGSRMVRLGREEGGGQTGPVQG